MSTTKIGGALLPLAIWFLAADLFAIYPRELLPQMMDVFGSLRQLVWTGQFLEDGRCTIARWLCGFVCGAVAGTLLGVLIGYSQPLRELLELPLEFLRALPVTALLPLFLLLCGVGDTGKIMMAAFPSALLVAVYTEAGIRGCSRARSEMARTFGATEWQLLLLVRLPEMLPSTLLGLRLALALSLVVSIVAEMFVGTESGLGQRLYEAYMLNASERLYAHLLILGSLGYISSRALQTLEVRSAAWVGR